MTTQQVWKLPEHLDAHGVARHELMQELGDGKGRGVHKWQRLSERLDTEALNLKRLGTPKKLTGEEVAISDVPEYGNEPNLPEHLTVAGIPYISTPKTDTVLTEHSDILRRSRKKVYAVVKNTDKVLY